MKGGFIPALGYHFLTPVYEPVNRVLAGHIWKAVARETLERAGEGAEIVDLGCGPGTVLRLLRSARADLHLTGIDIDPQILAIAGQKAQGMDIRLLQSSSDRLPLPDHSVDIATSTLVCHHLADDVKRKTFQEVRRILKSDGTFVLCDFSSPAHPWIRHVVSLLNKTGSKSLPQMDGQLLRLAHETGATVYTLRTFYGCISLHLCTFRS